MSDVSSALGGATHEGRLTVRDTGARGMLTLRGDLGSAAVTKAVKAGAGTAVPGIRQILTEGDRAALADLSGQWIDRFFDRTGLK